MFVLKMKAMLYTWKLQREGQLAARGATACLGRYFNVFLCRESTNDVTQAFADPPPPPLDLSHLSLSSEKRADAPPEPVVPLENPPKTLIEWAVLILDTADPTLKVSSI